MNSTISFLYKSLIIFLLSSSIILAEGGKKHHFALFSGVTSNLYTEHSDITLGFDYEYHIGHHFGLGIIGDHVFADHSETLLMAGVFYHPISSMKLIIGNGLAFAEEVENETDSHNNHTENNTETKTVSHYVLRLGVGYDFHLNNFTVGPSFSWDNISGHSSLAYGITIGLSF